MWPCYIAILYHPHHPQEKLNTGSAPFGLLLSSRQVVTLCPVGSLLCQGCHAPLIPLRWAKKRLWCGKHHVEPGAGSNLSQPELEGARQSRQRQPHPWLLCGINSSIQSGGMVGCGQPHFWGFVCHCFLSWAQGQGDSAAGSGHNLVFVLAATWN